MKFLIEQFNWICLIYRSMIKTLLNLQQKVDRWSLNQFELVFRHVFEQRISLIEHNRLQLLIHRYRHVDQIRRRLILICHSLIKCYLFESEYSFESNRLKKFFFDDHPEYQRFEYQQNDEQICQSIWIRCRRDHLKEKHIQVKLNNLHPHSMTKIRYDFAHKSSNLFQINFQRIVTKLDQLTIAIPCFHSAIQTSIMSTQQQFIARLR
jgi:hypothetical protein